MIYLLTAVFVNWSTIKVRRLVRIMLLSLLLVIASWSSRINTLFSHSILENSWDRIRLLSSKLSSHRNVCWRWTAVSSLRRHPRTGEGEGWRWGRDESGGGECGGWRLLLPPLIVCCFLAVQGVVSSARAAIFLNPPRVKMIRYLIGCSPQKLEFVCPGD